MGIEGGDAPSPLPVANPAEARNEVYQTPAVFVSAHVPRSYAVDGGLVALGAQVCDSSSESLKTSCTSVVHAVGLSAPSLRSAS
jgi:hypothetical protein